MMIVMRDGAPEDEIQGVIDKLHAIGAEAHLSRGKFKTVIGAIGDREKIAEIPLAALPGVETVIPIMRPYKLVSREFHPENTVVQLSLIHISEPTRLGMISYAVFCLKKKNS